MNENENLENQQEQTPEEVLAEMKKTMVPREELEKVTQKYNQLFKSVANGVQNFGEEPQEKSEKEKLEEFKMAIEELDGHKVRKPIEHAERLLAIDKYRQEHGERSIFEPTMGERTEDVIASAEKTREVLQNAIDNSNGSDAVFMAVLQNSLRDVVK